MNSMTGIPKDANEVNALLDAIDVNADGEFSRDEVSQVIMRMGALQTSLKQFKAIALLAFAAPSIFIGSDSSRRVLPRSVKCVP